MARQICHARELEMSKTSKAIFNPDTEQVLVRGLNAMTRACDALSKQNEDLNKDIEALKKKVTRLQERVLIDADDRE